VALYAGTPVDFVIDFLSVTMSGLAVVILLGRFRPRATWHDALAGLIAAVLVSLIVLFVPGQSDVWIRPIIPPHGPASRPKSS